MGQEARDMKVDSALTGTDDFELVDLAREGDVDAFEALYRRHIGRVYAVCLRMTGDPSLAEDVSQEAFIRAWEKLDSFGKRSAFGTWLHRIAVNVVLARGRKTQREAGHLRLVREAVADMLPPGHGGDQRIDLEQAIGSLPERARQVFVLAAVYGHSHEETAGMLGVAVGTCKAQLHRARRLLAERL